MSAVVPQIIQGGMGVAISSWRLARAVSLAGQLGVVSGTALDVVLSRRLQLGDPGGHLRRAMDDFPFPKMARRIIDRYYIAGGKAADQPFRPCPVPSQRPSVEHQELMVVANFVEVYLAREGHDGLVGINYLEKIQAPLLPSIFGAMLAGVDYVLMGAGIPRTIPGILDQLAQGEPCSLRLDVVGCEPTEEFLVEFNPRQLTGGDIPWIERPQFLAIVSSATLATMLARKANGRVDGFVIEGPTAGGHNAPPRGGMKLNEHGEPNYGPRDAPDLQVFRDLGKPFWMAGSFGNPDRLREAQALGAAGIQVGTAFAYCQESGLDAELRQQVLELARQGTIQVFTDPVASPTGFPFKVVQLPGTLSDISLRPEERRGCDLGHLRHGYRREDGSLGWRCPADKIEAFVRKGGALEETAGRVCLCNALLANVGLGQIREDGEAELPLITSGNDLSSLAQLLANFPGPDYTAAELVAYLLSGSTATPPARPTPEIVVAN